MDDRVRGRGRQPADLTYRNAITAAYRSQLDVRREIEFALAELRSFERVKFAARTFHRSDPRVEFYRVGCDSGFLSRLEVDSFEMAKILSTRFLSEGKKHAFPEATNNKRRIDFHAAFLCAWREVREEGDRVVCEFVGSGSRSRQQEPRYVCVRT